MKTSASQGKAPCTCPRCPESDEVDAVATVGHSESERGSTAFLDCFKCERGHDLVDLSVAQERAILSTAQGWISDAIDALRDAYWDSRIDRYKEEGF